MTAVQAPATRLPDRLDECLAALGRALACPSEIGPLRSALGALEAAVGAVHTQPRALTPVEAERLRARVTQLRASAHQHRHAATRALTALGLDADAGGRRSTGLREQG